ncbi:hypothetical protein STHU_13570 [Allostella humosa]|nr:hypothetical protein STHU_13570 [Stella humosa]
MAGAASRFENGWFYPGDGGLIDATGELEVCGRIDDLIIIGGQKVYPRDIESRLATHPAVADAAAFAMPHPIRGHVALAAVILHRPAASGELLAHCRDTLGADRAPAAILILDALPRTEIGKVDRRALQEMVAARQSAPGSANRRGV